MKICPQCRKSYEDDNLNFCLDDGTALAPSDQGAPTMVMPPPRQTATPPGGAPTQWQQPLQVGQPVRKSKKWPWVLLVVVLLLLLCGGGLGGLLMFGISKADLNFNIDQSTPRISTTRSPIPSQTADSTEPADETEDLDTPNKSGGHLTMANYNRLKPGMARAEVEKILGGKGKQISSSSGGGFNFTVEQWQGEDFDTVILTFQNDKLQYMTQSGLE